MKLNWKAVFFASNFVIAYVCLLVKFAGAVIDSKFVRQEFDGVDHDLAVDPLQRLLAARRIGDRAQEIADCLEARAHFVVGAHDRPRRVRTMGRFQHGLDRVGIGVPLVDRRIVDRADLPAL